MDHFSYRAGHLYCEDVEANQLAQEFGTPLFVYSKKTLTEHLTRFRNAFASLNPLICFSVKSCNNLAVLRCLAEAGAGMDVVSGGEIYRAKLAGVDMRKVVYAGSAKTDREIEEALLAEIGWLNIESTGELEAVIRLSSEMRRHCRAALRVNPDVFDPTTHPKTTTGNKGSKFGVDIADAAALFDLAKKSEFIELCGIHIHLGSPIASPQPYVEAITKVLDLASSLRSRGFTIEMIDIGGGFLADYGEMTSDWQTYARAICPMLLSFVEKGGLVVIEPGRAISANAGVLLTRVTYIKDNGGAHYLLTDTGMHHLVRITLYDALHFIWPTRVQPDHEPRSRNTEPSMRGLVRSNVAGPICESGDYLARDRLLPPVAPGDVLCVFSTGAYSMVMASQYNAFPRPAEVLVADGSATLVRARETYADLVRLELK